MKVGDLIRDYECSEDLGIVLKIQERPELGSGLYYYVCATNGYVSWLDEGYVEDCECIPQKCEVVNEGR